MAPYDHYLIESVRMLRARYDYELRARREMLGALRKVVADTDSLLRARLRQTQIKRDAALPPS